MLPIILALAGAALLAIALLGIAFVLGMRRKSRWVQGPVIWVSRRWLNPRQMGTAGQPGSYAGIIRHVGRKTGKAYETPVTPVRADDGFVIALPYGRHASWLRNVLAAGSASIVWEGQTYAVERPEVVPTGEVIAHFPNSDRRSFRLMKVDECLRVRTIAVGSAG
jgi:deazaflavin-dependent oxidoreductase (nitroreductase family)